MSELVKKIYNFEIGFSENSELAKNLSLPQLTLLNFIYLLINFFILFVKFLIEQNFLQRKIIFKPYLKITFNPYYFRVN